MGRDRCQCENVGRGACAEQRRGRERVRKRWGRAWGVGKVGGQASTGLHRSKTDQVDARSLLEYVRRMEFRPWEPPSGAALELREVGRRLSELVQGSVDEENRLHSKSVAGMSETVVKDVKGHIVQIRKRIDQIEKGGVRVIQQDADLREEFEILMGITGVGQRSAMLILSELCVLDRSMSVKQIVAYAGLDPRVYESGTSVEEPARISKVGNARLRAILYMNALSAIRHDR